MIYYNDSTDFPGGQQQFVEDYTPSAGRMFSEGIDAGFRDVSFMLAKSVMDMDAAENAPLLTKEDWETSKFYDPEIKWDDSFTTPKARLLKERRDRERELGFLLERAGIGSTAAFYGGALVGTVPDPVNYIPFVGIASKAKSAAVLGKIAQSGRLGRAATSAADAAIGTAAYQFFPGYGLMAERETYQVKYDMRDALTDLGLALGLGFGLGAALGPIHPKDPNQQTLLELYREREGSIISLNKDGEPIFTPKKDLPPEPINTPAQQSWDSVAPTDKTDALQRRIAADAAGEVDATPIKRSSSTAGQGTRIRYFGKEYEVIGGDTKITPEGSIKATLRIRGADGKETTIDVLGNNNIEPLGYADDVWDTKPNQPAPDPVPDDLPIDANEARLQQLEAELDERIRTEEAEGRLSETDARELAYIDEEVKAQEGYHQALFEVTECLIRNG